jgi:hypothetical protein
VRPKDVGRDALVEEPDIESIGAPVLGSSELSEGLYEGIARVNRFLEHETLVECTDLNLEMVRVRRDRLRNEEGCCRGDRRNEGDL